MIRLPIAFLRKNWYLMSALLAALTMVLFITDRREQAEQDREARQANKVPSLNALIQAAQRQENNRELARATDTYHRAIQIYSAKATHLHLNLSRLYAQQGTHDRALTHVSAFLSETPDLDEDETATALELKGDILSAQRKWDAAIVAYQSVFTSHSAYDSMDRVRYKTGEAYFQTEHPDAARPDLIAVENSLDIERRARSRVLLAAIALDKDDPPQALQYATTVAKDDIHSPAVYYTALILAGRAHTQAGALELAQASYLEAAKFLPPRGPETERWLSIVRFLVPEGPLSSMTDEEAYRAHFADALTVADRLVRSGKHDAARQLYEGLGDLILPEYDRLARTAMISEDEARLNQARIEALQTAIQMNAVSEERVRLDQKLEQWKNKHRQARAATGTYYLKAFQAGRAIDVHSSRYLLQAATNFESAQFISGVVEALELYIAANFGDKKAIAKPRHDLGLAYMQMGRDQKAVEVFDSVIESDTENSQLIAFDARISRAEALENLGQFKEAARSYEYFFGRQFELDTKIRRQFAPDTQNRVQATLGLARLYLYQAMRDPDQRAAYLAKSMAMAEEFIAREKRRREAPNLSRPEDPAMALQAQFFLGKARFEVASDLFAEEDLTRARDEFRAAEEAFKHVARAKVDPDPSATNNRRQSDLFSAESVLKQAMCSKQPDPAQVQRALDEFRAVAGSYMRTQEALYAMVQASTCLRLIGREEEADRWIEKARRAMEQWKKAGSETGGGYVEEQLSALQQF